MARDKAERSAKYWEYVKLAQEEIELGISTPLEMARLRTIIDDYRAACELALSLLKDGFDTGCLEETARNAIDELESLLAKAKAK